MVATRSPLKPDSKTISSYVTKLSLNESDPYYEKLQVAKRKLQTFIDAHQGSRAHIFPIIVR